MLGVLLFLLLFVNPARADINFPFILPMGDQEPMLGNTGVAISGSTGNVLYNPAGLAELKGNRISASGSAYALVKGRTFAISDTADFTTYVSVPNMLVASRQIKSWTVAFGIFEPLSIEGDIVADQSAPGLNGTAHVDEDFKTEEQYIGISTGHELGESGWRLGGGLFVHREVNTTTGSMFVSPNSGSVYLSSITKTDLEVLSLLPILGVQKDISPDLQAGLRVIFPSYEILGRGHTVTNAMVYDGTTLTPNKIDLQTSGHYNMPTDLTGGVSWKTGSRVTLLADLGVQFPTVFDDMPNSPQKTQYNTVTTVRWNVGCDYRLTDEFSLDFGMLRSPYTNAKSPTAGPPVNFSGVSLGGYDREKTVSTGLGAFYINSRTDGSLFNFTSDPYKGYSAYGIMLSSSINY